MLALTVVRRPGGRRGSRSFGYLQLLPGQMRWSGESWDQLGPYFTGLIASFAVLPNDDLVAAGAFGEVGFEVQYMGVARWDGNRWNAMKAWE